MLILLMGSDSCHTTTCQWRPCFVLISATPAGYRYFDLRSRWSRSLRLHNFHYPSAAHAAYTKDCAAGLGWQYDTNIDPAYDGTYWSQLYGSGASDSHLFGPFQTATEGWLVSTRLVYQMEYAAIPASRTLPGWTGCHSFHWPAQLNGYASSPMRPKRALTVVLLTGFLIDMPP